MSKHAKYIMKPKRQTEKYYKLYIITENHLRKIY